MTELTQHDSLAWDVARCDGYKQNFEVASMCQQCLRYINRSNLGPRTAFFCSPPAENEQTCNYLAKN